MELDPEDRALLGYATSSMDDSYAAAGGLRRYSSDGLRMFANIGRLQLIDLTSATLAFARWARPYHERLTLGQVAQLTGRARSTVTSVLSGIECRLDRLHECPAPSAETSYVPARRLFGHDRAAFLFWLAQTLSPERAAELSGHGLAGPSAKARALKSRVESSLGTHPELTTFHKALSASRGRSGLGKRRNDTDPRTPDPIPWLDDLEVELEAAVMSAGERAFERAQGEALMAEVSTGRESPRDRLRRAFDENPESAVGIALELIEEEWPQDPFRPRA